MGDIRGGQFQVQHSQSQLLKDEVTRFVQVFLRVIWQCQPEGQSAFMPSLNGHLGVVRHAHPYRCGISSLLM